MNASLGNSKRNNGKHISFYCQYKAPHTKYNSVNDCTSLFLIQKLQGSIHLTSRGLGLGGYGQIVLPVYKVQSNVFSFSTPSIIVLKNLTLSGIRRYKYLIRVFFCHLLDQNIFFFMKLILPPFEVKWFYPKFLKTWTTKNPLL